MASEHAQQYFVDPENSAVVESIDEEEMRALVDALPQIVWTARRDGRVDYCNARWYEFTGLRREESDYGDWKRVLYPDDLQPCLDAWQHAVQTGEPFEWECRFSDGRTGNYRWFLGSALPARTPAGGIHRWFGTWTDVDEQKKAHHHLTNQAAALLEADRRKNDFLAMLAHELRNPLASMTSALALLETDDAKERGWAIDVIERQTRQLTGLVDELLDIARIDSGKIRLSKEPLDVAAILDRAVQTMRPAIDLQRHALAADYPSGMLFVEGDAARLEQIVVNLLANATKYTPPEGHLYLGARRHEENVMIIVRDDGSGIDPAKLPKIFDLFTQGERAGVNSKDGLGLGLTIVKKLAELHGGTVSATSAGIGQGSEFAICLPACAPVPLVRPKPVNRLPDTAPSNARILVVDDHADSADALARLLRRRGYETDTAYDGHAAFESARAFRPQVVLLDIDLPLMDGCEVAMRLRQDPVQKNCLLVALTGFSQEEDRKRMQDAGFDHHFVKPIDLAFLQGFISDSLAKR